MKGSLLAFARPLVLAVLLAGVAQPAWAEVPASPDQRLRQLFHDTDEASLRRNPLNALYRGDLLTGWYQDWCLIERERYQCMFVSLLDKLMASDVAAAANRRR